MRAQKQRREDLQKVNFYMYTLAIKKRFFMERLWVPQLILIFILLCLITAENTHWYHIILLWVVCVLFAYLAFFAYFWNYKGLALIMGITAFIYIPIYPIISNRAICETINLGTIVLVIPLSFLIKYSKVPKNKS